MNIMLTISRNDGTKMLRMVNRSNLEPLTIDDILSDGQRRSGHFEVAPSTVEMRIQEPLYFAIADNVADPARERDIRTNDRNSTRVSASYIVRLDNGIVLPHSFIAITEDDGILSDSFRAYGAIERAGIEDLGNGQFNLDVSRKKYIDGTGVLLGIQTNNNFFHWLVEAMPRIYLLETIGYNLSNAVIVVPPMRPWMVDVFNFYTKNKYKTLSIGDSIHQFKELIVPARGLFNINTFARHAIDMVQNTSASTVLGFRKLYISRAKSSSRRIGNEPALIEILKLRGFEIVFPEDLSFEDQVSLFSSASHVAGALGAGLTNAVFSGPGSVLVEFAPEGRTGDASLFSNMCDVYRKKYACIVGAFSGGFDRPFDRRDFDINLSFVKEISDIL